MPKLRNRILSVALSIVVVLAAAFFLQSTNLDSETPPELDAKSELTGALTTGSGAAYYYDSNSPAFTGDASNTVSANAGSVKYLYSNQNQTLSDFIARIDGRNSIVSNDRGQSPGQFRFVNFGGVNSGSKYKVYPIEYFTSNYDSTKYCCEALSLNSEIKRNQVVIVYNSGDYEYKNNPTSAEMGTGEVDLGYEGWHLVYLGSNNQISTPNGLGVLSAYLLNANGSSNKVFSNSGSDNFSVTSNGVYWVKVGNVSASSSNGLPSVPDEGSQVANNQDSNASSGSAGSGDGSADSESKPLYQYTERNVSVGNINANCFNSLMGSGNSMGNLDSSCNQLNANLETDNPEVVNALLASLRTDQEDQANEGQGDEIVLGENQEPISGDVQMGEAQRIFANTVNVLHFDNDIFLDVCGNSNAIDYADLRIALINNYDQALSLNSIDLGLNEDGTAIFAQANLDGFNYDSTTGVLTAINPFSLQSVTTDDSSYVFNLRVGIQNSQDNDFDFSVRPSFNVSQASSVDPEFEVSFVYGNGSSIRLYESGAICPIPRIPMPNASLVVSSLMPDQTNQCGDLDSVGRNFVGSNLTLTNTYLQEVSISELTLRLDNSAGVDLLNSTFNGVSGSLDNAQTRLVFTFEDPIVLAQNSSNVFDLKLFNANGESFNVNVTDLEVIGRLASQEIVNTLYANDLSPENTINYTIDYRATCVPESESNIVFSQLFDVSDSSTVCDQFQHANLSNSFLVVETDEQNDFEISELTFDIQTSDGANLGELSYQLKYANLSVNGTVLEDNSAVKFEFSNPLIVRNSQAFEVLVSSDQVGATGNLTLTLQDIVDAEVDVVLSYEFATAENLCPIVPPLYEVSAVNSVSRNFCQNIEEVSGSSISVEVVLNRVVNDANIKLQFAEALPNSVTFSDGAIGEDRTTVSFEGQTVSSGRNVLSFDASFTDQADINFDFKVTNVSFSIDESSGEYNVNLDEGNYEVNSKIDCSDDSSPFIHVVSSSAVVSYCEVLVPDDLEPIGNIFTLINPTDEDLLVNNIIFKYNRLDGDNTDLSSFSYLLKDVDSQFEVEDNTVKISFAEITVSANSAQDFEVLVKSQEEFDLSFGNLLFNFENTEVAVKDFNHSYIQKFDAECPDPGTVSVESMESIKSATCVDIADVDKFIDQRLVINNTTDSVQSLSVVKLQFDSPLPIGLEVKINDVEGDLANNVLTFDFDPNLILEVGRNVFDVVYSLDDALDLNELTFTSNQVKVDLQVTDLEIPQKTLAVGTQLNFVECQAAIQVVAFNASDSACEVLDPNYELSSNLVVFNPKEELLEIDKIVFKADLSDPAVSLLINQNPGVYDAAQNTVTFTFDDLLEVPAGSFEVLEFVSKFGNAYEVQVDKIYINDLEFNQSFTHTFENQAPNCFEPGVVNLLPIVEADVDGNRSIDEMICLDIDGLRDTYSTFVKITNGYSEDVGVKLTLTKNDNPVSGLDINMIKLGDRNFDADGTLELTLEPGLNVFDLNVNNTVAINDLKFEISLLQESDLYRLGDSNSIFDLKVFFNGDCFRSYQSLTVIDQQQSLNSCLAELNDPLSIDLVYNNNTQDIKQISSLKFNGPNINIESVEIAGQPVQGFNAGYNFVTSLHTLNFNDVDVQANDLVTVKILFDAKEGNINLTNIELGVSGLEIGTNSNQGADYRITNDLSDCEGLVINGLRLVQDSCVLDEDQSLTFAFSIYNPTDLPYSLFTYDNQGSRDGLNFEFSGLNGFQIDLPSTFSLNLEEGVSANSTKELFVKYNSIVETFVLSPENYGLSIIDNNSVYSEASDLNAQVSVSEEENCGNVVAPENILVSANPFTTELIEQSELPYCVYGSTSLRTIPINVANRFSQDINISSIDVQVLSQQGSDLNFSIPGFIQQPVVDGSDVITFAPQNDITLEPFDVEAIGFLLETSLLFEGQIRLTVNVEDLDGNLLNMPVDYNQHIATIMLAVNVADGGVECSEEDLFSFVQEKDDLIVNSQGRPQYLSSELPVGKLYINPTHESYNSIQAFGNQGSNIFNELNSIVYFSNFSLISFNEFNLLNSREFTLPNLQADFTSNYYPDFSVDNAVEGPSFSVDVEVFRFDSDWDLQNENFEDNVWVYEIGFNMPERVDTLLLNLFDGESEFLSTSGTISHLDESNIGEFLEGFKLELINGANSVELINSQNQAEIINFAYTETADVLFDNFNQVRLTLDYAPGVDRLVPDLVFFEDSLVDNNSLNINSDNPIFSKFYFDDDQPTYRINNIEIENFNYGLTIDQTEIEFFIGSPVRLIPFGDFGVQ